MNFWLFLVMISFFTESRVLRLNNWVLTAAVMATAKFSQFWHFCLRMATFIKTEKHTLIRSFVILPFENSIIAKNGGVGKSGWPIHFGNAMKNFWIKYNTNYVVLVSSISGNIVYFVLFWNLHCPLAFHVRTDSNKMWFLKRLKRRWWKQWKINEIALATVLNFDNLIFRKTPSLLKVS